MGMKDWFRGLFSKPARRDPYAGTYGNSNSLAFAGGGIGRLTASLATSSQAINAELDGSLVIMRARARQLCQSNEYGRRFLNLVATNVVGRTGPVLQVRAYMAQTDRKKAPVLDKAANDAIEIHWARWGQRADIAGRMHLAHMLRVTAKAVARDGEALVRLVRNRDLPYGMALQLLEIDRLDETMNATLQGGGAIRQGVEIDSTGRPVAYWLKSAHPGDRYLPGNLRAERVAAENIRHVFLPERAEQVRGYTWLHAVLLRSAQLHGFNEAAVLAARIGASKVAVLQRTDEAAPDATTTMADGQSGGQNGGAMHMNVEGGEMFELPPGYSLNSWNPEYPHANFESFVKTAMHGISAGLDVANHNLSGDMSGVNYSSARIAELSEREQWMVLQDWLIHTLVEPIYKDWLASALIRGDITFELSGNALPADKLSKFANASRFQGRRWKWVDPSKDIEAARAGVELGITSRTRIAAEQGVDLDDVLDELAQEKALMQQKGLSTAPAAQAAPPVVKPAEDAAE